MIVGAWLALNLFDSPTGRALRALHGSDVAARTMGIDVPRHKLHAFVISAVYASVSGSLLALMNRLVTPDVAGFMHSVHLVTMTVLGGVSDRCFGAIFGATILTALPQVLTVFPPIRAHGAGHGDDPGDDFHARWVVAQSASNASAGGRENDIASRS
jgi:branched-chain amino acid transport system permease protein